jgi:hypothetical protein
MHLKIHYWVHKKTPLDTGQARWIHSRPSHTIISTFILTLFSYLRLALPSDIFPLAVPTKMLYTYLLFCMHVIYTSHSILPHLIFLKKSSKTNRIISHEIFSILLVFPYPEVKIFSSTLWFPPEGVSILSWWWGLRDTVTWRAMPAVV